MDSRTLEHRLFRSSMKYGLVLMAVLVFHDAVIRLEWISLLLESGVILFLALNFVLLEKRPPSNAQIILFGAFIIPIVNIAWLTGGGVNLINVSVYFICSSMMMLLLQKRYYSWFGILVFLNLLVLYYLEAVLNVKLFGISMEENNAALERDYMYAVILFFFGGFLIAFTKLNYNRDREILFRTNKDLQIAQEALNETVSELEEQKAALDQTKANLEFMVKERTQDLAQANERLLNKNQQLEQYSYIISHNLKAPVAQIKGLVHLLPDDRLMDPLTKETLERLKDSTLNLEKVLADLSAVIRVEKNIQQQWQLIDLEEVIDEVVDSLKNPMQEKGVVFSLVNSNLPRITAIKPYIYSVLHNIIENSIKYADDTKPTRYVKVDFSESPNFYILSITDNGIGIDMDAASGKLFQMYQRFNTTHPGQGFGLYLVKSQMEAINGQVEMDSILGRGTTFRLFFKKKP